MSSAKRTSTVRMVLSLTFMVPVLATLGGLARLDSPGGTLIGIVVGGALGVFFGLVFGGADGKWLDFVFGPERLEGDGTRGGANAGRPNEPTGRAIEGSGFP